MRYRWLLLLLALSLAGCGSSFDPSFSSPTGASVQRSVSLALSSAAGGRVSHPAGHSVEFEPGSLSSDGLVTLTLVPSGDLSLRNTRDFRLVGDSLRLDLAPGVKVVGSVRFRLPRPVGRPDQHAVYLHLRDGLVAPLAASDDLEPGQIVVEKTEDLSGLNVSLQASADQPSSSSLLLSVVDESGWQSRPAHVPWSSYNLYVFRDGSFQRLVNQGTPLESLPEPGSAPLMVVHGLGSNIANFNATASYLQAQGVFTQIYGFEYDTLQGLMSVGPQLDQAYASLPAASDWSHLAHSMGTLVSRVAFEGGTPAPYTSNRVVLAAGPHLGTPVINVLQGDLDLFDSVIRYLVINEVMDFRNADGTPCQVDITAQGFSDLAENNGTLQSLNDGAAERHPLETYHTFGGNAPGLEYDVVGVLLGVYPDDGLVPLVSANPGTAIGAASAAVVAENHSTIVDDTSLSLPLILERLRP